MLVLASVIVEIDNANKRTIGDSQTTNKVKVFPRFIPAGKNGGVKICPTQGGVQIEA